MSLNRHIFPKRKFVFCPQWPLTQCQRHLNSSTIALTSRERTRHYTYASCHMMIHSTWCWENAGTSRALKAKIVAGTSSPSRRLAWQPWQVSRRDFCVLQAALSDTNSTAVDLLYPELISVCYSFERHKLRERHELDSC